MHKGGLHWMRTKKKKKSKTVHSGNPREAQGRNDCKSLLLIYSVPRAVRRSVICVRVFVSHTVRITVTTRRWGYYLRRERSLSRSIIGLRSVREGPRDLLSLTFKSVDPKKSQQFEKDNNKGSKFFTCKSSNL